MNRRDNGENEIFQSWLLDNKSAQHFVIKGKKAQINEFQAWNIEAGVSEMFNAKMLKCKIRWCEKDRGT